MRQINLVEGKVVAPEGMKVGIVAARFNEIIVNKLLGGAVDGLVRHGVEEENITAAWVPGAFESPESMMQSSAWEQLSAGILPTMIWCVMNRPKESRRLNLQQEFRYYSE